MLLRLHQLMLTTNMRIVPVQWLSNGKLHISLDNQCLDGRQIGTQSVCRVHKSNYLQMFHSNYEMIKITKLTHKMIAVQHR